MKYTIDIDTSFKTGEQAINYLRKLKGKAVFIQKFEPLTPEELALPMGRKPTRAELREYLDRKQGQGITLEAARKKILASLNKKKK